MAIFTKSAEEIFSPITAGGSPRGASMGETQVWGVEVERVVEAALQAGGNVYETKAGMEADLAPSANTSAIVIGDTVSNNGLYRKSGASGAGSWVRVGDVPGYSFIKATNTDSGDPDAITATSLVGIGESQLVALPIMETNTAADVTVAFNGGAALSIKTASGANPGIGALPAGTLVAGYVDGETFRLLSDIASSAIQAAAEAARDASEGYRDEAANYAALALNNWVVDTFAGDGVTTAFTLTLSPGSANNTFVTVGGVLQLKTAYTIDGASLNFSEPPPGDGAIQNIEVAFGSAIEIGAPADGSVTTSKMADNAVTQTKIADDAVGADQIKAAEAEAIKTVLGISGGVSGAVSQVQVFTGTGTPGNSTVTDAALGNTFAVTRTSDTSKLVVVGFALVRLATTNSDDIGCDLQLRYFNGSTYVVAPGASSGNLLDTDGNVVARILRGGLTLFAALDQSHVDDDLWNVQFWGNALYSTCSMTLQKYGVIAVEYSD